MSVLMEFLHEIPVIIGEVALALGPVIVIFAAFQIIFIRMPPRQLLRTAVGIAYTFAGLVLFLTGVSVGFESAGSQIGAVLGASQFRWVLVPVGLVMGFVIVFAEPAVAVLNQQVEKVSGGAISQKLMMSVLCVSMAIAVGLGMIRVLTGLSIWWIIVPGYAIALILMKFSPPIFTAIAFDSGGVASGPMTATFLLPFAVGACSAIPERNPITDAFGMVAMVAMMPLIAIQVMGAFFGARQRRTELTAEEIAALDDDEDDEADPEKSIAQTKQLCDDATHDGARALDGGEPD